MEFYEIPGITKDQIDVIRKIRHEIEKESSGQRQVVETRFLVELAQRALQDGLTDVDAFEERLREGLQELETIRRGLIGNLLIDGWGDSMLAAKASQIPELKRLHKIFSEGYAKSDSKDKDEYVQSQIESRLFFNNFDTVGYKADEYHYCPVNFDSLTSATKRYLERPWMQCQMLDWFLINGFLYTYLDSYLEQRYTGALFGDTIWRRIFYRGNKLGYFWATILWWLFSLVIDWLVLPVLAGVAFYFGYTYVALGLLVIFGIILVLRVIHIPKFIERQRFKRRLIEGLQELLGMKLYASNVLWSPATMMDRIETFERKYPELPIPALRSLLTLAMKRGTEISI
jgi:hypothetical protein